MKTFIEEYLEKITYGLFYISIVLMTIATGVGRVFSNCVQMYLIVAILMCFFTAIFVLCSKKRVIHVGSAFGLYLFCVVIFILSTIKYFFSIVQGQNITFFTVYQMPIFLVWAVCSFILMVENKK